jgi:hypothetical protein
LALPAPPLAERDYWRFADRIATYFEPFWNPLRAHYEAPGAKANVIYNSSLLLTHAVAAHVGHRGLSRNDERARLLARRLCESPPWSEVRSQSRLDPQFHDPGWREFLDSNASDMDKSIDPKVAEALAWAWRARGELALPQETTVLIRDRVSRCARGPFFRYPSVRLNQINWNTEIYAHAATVAGDEELLRSDYREQVQRFIAGIKRPWFEGGSTNLGRGYQFHYLPDAAVDHRFNLDSAEYANITCQFIRHYEQALRAGLDPLPEENIELLRAWVERIVCGYWTHSGYLNWDTGLGFKRWHIGRTWAFAQQGLLAIATAPRFQRRPELGEWAKYFFDRGLVLYERLAEENAGGLLAPQLLFGVNQHPEGLASREMFAARMQANAASAVALGLGSLNASQPPPIYSFDLDTGRLAVSTPTYSTAVLPVNQGAFPYGGLELARLYDGDQRVLANIGGVSPAAFGLVVRDSRERVVLVSQRGRREPGLLRAPLSLDRSPRGAVRRITAANSYPSDPYAGAFDELSATGLIERAELALETRHTFRADDVETEWALVQRGPGRAYTVDLLFPSWGEHTAVDAVLRSGSRLPLTGGRRVPMRAVSYFHLAGEQAGYVVIPTLEIQAADARTVRVAPQSSNPYPGPTLAVALVRLETFREVRFAARIAPATTRRDADRVWRRLRPARS